MRENPWTHVHGIFLVGWLCSCRACQSFVGFVCAGVRIAVSVYVPVFAYGSVFGACQESRRISPQPFAPRGKGRFARVRGARQSADWRRPRPLRAPALSASVRRLKGANCAALGTGAFGRSGVVRACHRAARPAWGAPRIRRMRAIPLRRNTAIAAWPRPGGADERPAVRAALGRASAPSRPPR